MQFMKLITLMAVMSFSVAHASEVEKYSAQTGVQVIARSVVSKKLVDPFARKVIRLALETGRAEFGAMECDRALGTDICSLDVTVKDDETTDDAEETTYRLNVHIYQGTVRSATWELIAG